MSRPLHNLGSFRSKNFSSFQSSNSMLMFDDESKVEDSRVPESIEKLESGLELVLDESFVENVWTSEKTKETLQDLLVRYKIKQ